jgi:hypothetical protein
MMKSGWHFIIFPKNDHSEKQGIDAQLGHSTFAVDQLDILLFEVNPLHPLRYPRHYLIRDRAGPCCHLLYG